MPGLPKVRLQLRGLSGRALAGITGASVPVPATGAVLCIFLGVAGLRGVVSTSLESVFPTFMSSVPSPTMWRSAVLRSSTLRSRPPNHEIGHATSQAEVRQSSASLGCWGEHGHSSRGSISFRGCFSQLNWPNWFDSWWKGWRVPSAETGQLYV